MRSPPLWLLPLLLRGLGAAAPPPDSLSQLPAPQHAKIHLYNAEKVLSWEPPAPSNDTRPVVYRVQHKFTRGNWSNITVKSKGINCTEIPATQCNLTAANFEPYQNISLRVRAERGRQTSAWVMVPWFQHYRNVTVGPPKNILVTQGEGSLIVQVSSPFDLATSDTTFWYYIHYWERTAVKDTQVKGPVKRNSIVLDGLKPFKEYCLQVEARLFWETYNIIRPGILSNTSCHTTTADGSTKWQQDILVFVVVVSALLFLAGVSFFLFLKYRGLVKYWFHTPPSIPVQIEEYLKDPAQPILEALDKDSCPQDEAWDSVSIVSFPDKEQGALQTL